MLYASQPHGIYRHTSEAIGLALNRTRNVGSGTFGDINVAVMWIFNVNFYLKILNVIGLVINTLAAKYAAD